MGLRGLETSGLLHYVHPDECVSTQCPLLMTRFSLITKMSLVSVWKGNFCTEVGSSNKRRLCWDSLPDSFPVSPRTEGPRGRSCTSLRVSSTYRASVRRTGSGLSDPSRHSRVSILRWWGKGWGLSYRITVVSSSSLQFPKWNWGEISHYYFPLTKRVKSKWK